MNAFADTHTHTYKQNVTTVELDSSLLFHRAAADPPLPPVFYYSCGRETDHNSRSQQKAAEGERERVRGGGREKTMGGEGEGVGGGSGDCSLPLRSN